MPTYKKKPMTKAKSFGARMNQAESAVSKDMGRKGKKSKKMC